MARRLINVVDTARPVGERVSLMNWAQRGLPTLFFVASALFASPAHAANPNATLSFTGSNIDSSTCEASATIEWSHQHGIFRAQILVCDDTLVCNNSSCPCALVADSDESSKTGSLSGTNSHSLSSSLEGHMFHFVGSIFLRGRGQVTIESGELARSCSCVTCSTP
jgi:hypothetical protein